MKPELIETIRTSNPIEDVISEHAVLRRSGYQFRGLCPFHSERTASFYVHPQKGVFHCHGCGVGGDVFAFVRRHHNCSFTDAVMVLGKRAGIVINGSLRHGLKLPPLRQRLAAKSKAAFRKWLAMKMSELADRERKLYRRAEWAKVALSYYPDMEPAWAALADWYHAERAFTTFWQSATDKIGRYWLYRFWRKYGKRLPPR